MTVAVPELSVTVLFATVVEKPLPAMTSVVAFCARFAVFGVMPRFVTVATCTAAPLGTVLLVTTAVRFPTLGWAVNVTVIEVGLEEVTLPVAPRLNATELLAFAFAKPKPLIVTVVAVFKIVAVLNVTTGVTVATCTAAPLLTLLVVTLAVRLPALAGFVEKVTVSEVVVAAVTLPTALSLKVTALFAGVAEKPKPLIVIVGAFAARFAMFEVTTGITVATCTAAPLLPAPVVTTAFNAPTTWPLMLTVSCVPVAAVTVPAPVIAPVKATVLFAGVVSKPVPLMMTLVALAPMLATLPVTVGGTARSVTVAPEAFGSAVRTSVKLAVVLWTVPWPESCVAPPRIGVSICTS